MLNFNNKKNQETCKNKPIKERVSESKWEICPNGISSHWYVSDRDEETNWRREAKFFHVFDIKEKRIILACSGGPDSMMLLDFFVQKIIPCDKIIVAHINHLLRDTAQRDQEIVQDYCKKNNIICIVTSKDIKKLAKKTKTTLEECGRNERKKWLESIRKKYKADLIATAHHADDQAETLLYRIIKWTSITGLVGIEEYTWKYIRPLLHLTKKEILEYIESNNIPFWVDETNNDTSIPRNFLRNTILPELEKINPLVANALNRLGKSASLLKSWFDEFFAPIKREKSFTLDWYESLPLGFQKELIRYIFEFTNGSTHGLSNSLIDEIMRFLSTHRGGKKEIKHMKLTKKQSTVFISETR